MLTAFEPPSLALSSTGAIAFSVILQTTSLLGATSLSFHDVKLYPLRFVPAEPAHTEICAEKGVGGLQGVLLYGPPGTGKTLIARQIGKMLNGKEPKIVNGPEILNKFVGEDKFGCVNLHECSLDTRH